MISQIYELTEENPNLPTEYRSTMSLLKQVLALESMGNSWFTGRFINHFYDPSHKLQEQQR